MVSLAQRDRQPEIMDQPGLDTAAHRQALNGLRRTNAWSRVPAIIWRGLRDAGMLSNSQHTIRLLDIASGGGDVAIGLARLAARHGIPLQADGADISLTAIAHATAAAERGNATRVQFFQLNALHEPLPAGYDIVLCSLFLHHLAEPDAEQLLRRMAAATRACVLVDDLVRTRFGYFLAWSGARLLTRSHVVHIDGPLSVRAAFSLPEARALAERAGLRGATFRRHWPQRFLLTWKKT